MPVVAAHRSTADASDVVLTMASKSAAVAGVIVRSWAKQSGGRWSSNVISLSSTGASRTKVDPGGNANLRSRSASSEWAASTTDRK